MIALDLAKKAGFAWNQADHVYVATHVGPPIEQMFKVIQLLYNGYTKPILIEELMKFRNAKTTRSLLKRIGAVETYLELFGHDVEYINLRTVRKDLEVKSKEQVCQKLSIQAGFTLTLDEADAAALLIWRGKLSLPHLTFERVNWKEDKKCSLSLKAKDALAKHLYAQYSQRSSKK